MSKLPLFSVFDEGGTHWFEDKFGDIYEIPKTANMPLQVEDTEDPDEIILTVRYRCRKKNAPPKQEQEQKNTQRVDPF